MRFKNRRAIVTGGLSGIGEAVAKRITAEGGAVAVWDINGGIKVDISDYASVEAALAETVKQIGGVDILVNSAGITGPTVPVDGFPLDGWIKTMAVNLNGTFFTNRAVLPHMIQQNYGRIVNIASIAGKEGNPNASAYSASKAGVIGFTKALAMELAPTGITVNNVPPGFIDTPMLRASSDKMASGTIEQVAQNSPMKRPGRAEDIAAACTFLASEDAGYITGHTLSVNGGRYLS